MEMKTTSKVAAPPALNPRVSYIRVQAENGPAAYLGLGFVDTQGDATVQSWLGSDGGVLKLREGRIVGTAGLNNDWSNVSLSSLPSWEALAQGATIRYQRRRDELGTYAYNQVDTIQAVRIASPPPAILFGPSPQLPQGSWWVAETSTTLPTGYIAVRPSGSSYTWAYSYQCLSASACLGMQPWPPAPLAP